MQTAVGVSSETMKARRQCIFSMFKEKNVNLEFYIQQKYASEIKRK